MEITLVQAVLIGLWTGVCLSGMLLGIYTNRCLIMATGVGLILGDLPTGLAMGAVGELAFMGFGVSQGGSVPPNPMGPGIIGSIMAITMKGAGVDVATALALSFPFAVAFQVSQGGSVPPNPMGPGIIGSIMAITMKGAGVDVATALALSFPFAVAFQFVITLVYTGMAGVSAAATKALDNKQFKKFRLCCNLTVWVFLVLGFVIGFAGAMSAEGLEKVISLIPAWLNTGLSVAGAMLPAIGFAMILNVMAKKELIPFVLLGYCAIASGKGNKSGTETEEVEVEFEDGI